MQGGDLPFCFYTNDHDIYFWDLENYPPKKIHGFPLREDLERYSYIRKARKSLASELINTKIAGRDFQIAAIRSVMEAVEKRKRKFLLVMATGTGKTRTCIALVDALMRGGWIERTLFLVDRIALRDQTLDAFKEHLPNEPRWPKQGEKEISTDRRVYVSTYPTMLNIIRDENNPLSPHFFDLIVVDNGVQSSFQFVNEPSIHGIADADWSYSITPTNPAEQNIFDSWSSIMNISTRYLDYFRKNVFLMWESDYKRFIEEDHDIEHAQTIEELKANFRIWKAAFPIKGRAGSILYRAFIDYLINDASDAYLFGLCENFKR